MTKLVKRYTTIEVTCASLSISGLILATLLILSRSQTTTSVEEATDIMIQNQVRHLLVVENDDRNSPLGIIAATDFVGFLKENLNIDDVSAKILAFMQQHKDDEVIEELEQQGGLPKDVQKGGQEYENEEPRQGL